MNVWSALIAARRRFATAGGRPRLASWIVGLAAGAMALGSAGSAQATGWEYVPEASALRVMTTLCVRSVLRGRCTRVIIAFDCDFNGEHRLNTEAMKSVSTELHKYFRERGADPTTEPLDRFLVLVRFTVNQLLVKRNVRVLRREVFDRLAAPPPPSPSPWPRPNPTRPIGEGFNQGFGASPEDAYKTIDLTRTQSTTYERRASPVAESGDFTLRLDPDIRLDLHEKLTTRDYGDGWTKSGATRIVLSDYRMLPHPWVSRASGDLLIAVPDDGYEEALAACPG
ncbi:MAG: hypothetical protein AAGM38_04105 [Pseudomonadota bacterium]